MDLLILILEQFYKRKSATGETLVVSSCGARETSYLVAAFSSASSKARVTFLFRSPVASSFPKRLAPALS